MGHAEMLYSIKVRPNKKVKHNFPWGFYALPHSWPWGAFLVLVVEDVVFVACWKQSGVVVEKVKPRKK